MTGKKLPDPKVPGSPSQSGERPRLSSTASLGAERGPSPVGNKLSILKYKMSKCVVICDDQGVLDAYLEKALAEERTVFILFYAMWCIPCHALVPEYDKFAVAEQARGERSRLGFVAIDTTVNDHSLNEYDCEIFPALVTLRPKNGEMVVEHLEEALTVDQMKDFLKHWAKISTEEYEASLNVPANNSLGRYLKGRNRSRVSINSANSAVSGEAASNQPGDPAPENVTGTAPCSEAGDLEQEEKAARETGGPSQNPSRAPSQVPSRPESRTASNHESKLPSPQRSAVQSGRADSTNLPSRRNSRLPSVAPASRRPSHIPSVPPELMTKMKSDGMAAPEDNQGIRNIN